MVGRRKTSLDRIRERVRHAVTPPLVLPPGQHLCAYDYGMGGLWFIVRAPSAEAITKAIPSLVVVRWPPKALDIDRISAQGVADLEETSRRSWPDALKMLADGMR